MTAAASAPARPGPLRRPAGSGRSGRPVHSQATLLDSAVEAFIERGYEGTSMEHLAARLGITKSSIYHHVMGKAELYLMALDEAAARFAPLIDAVSAPDAGCRGAERPVRLVRSVLELPADRQRPLELLLSIRDGREEAPGALLRRRHLEARVADVVGLALRECGADEGAPVAVAVRTRLLLDLLCSLLVQRRLGRLPATDADGPAALAHLVTGCVR
ncbi:TetR/AcrR family transcriptional regulator [Streptomyces coeruleoprunus]|uniref:TetR/AcrR family transcriptional regulator n=1 Tax=Streptomyces coeruleoprunus TaxID=285563 RepID=A0ABV9XI17_9ACTN